MDFFFIFYNFEYQGSTYVPGKLIPEISNGSGEEAYFVVFVVFSNGGYLGFLT